MFPSFNMLQQLNTLGALTQDQVNAYFNGGAITADQVKQLGFNVPAAPVSSASAKPAEPAQPASSKSVDSNSAKPASSSVDSNSTKPAQSSSVSPVADSNVNK